MLFEVYSKEYQGKFLKSLTEFDDDANETYGDNFVSCKPEEQIAHFKKYHDAALGGSDKNSSWGWWSAKGGDKPFILKVKELTLLGFFTSEAGATQTLQYNQVPGPLKDVYP